MPKTVERSFLDLVRRSQLIEEDQLQKFLNEYHAQYGETLPERQEALAEAMVEAGLLSEWQAEMLLAGKHRGFRLGKYKLIGKLGKGGMSTVYLAEHVMMKVRRAIKVLPRNRVEDATYLDRFRIEARAAAKLDDPNIVRAYDIDEDNGTHYLVMEYVEGKDLHQLVKENGPLPYNSAADYIAQVASGLQHAHEMGLVHRDIKPANCLVDKNQVVKLLDMGLARIKDDEGSLTMDNNENVLGTADYLAPEQALNSHKADSRSDIYSLGCTLYYLLTGHPPFREGSISERLLKHQVEKPPSILKDRPDIPPTLLHICEKMMSKSANDRYQTAGEVAERLTEWLADRGQEVGESGKRGSDSGTGVGSDVFRRFAQSISRAEESGSLIRQKPPAPGGAKPKQAPPQQDDQEMELAPLDDETEGEEGDYATSASDANTDDLSAAEDTTPEGPHRSLIEEALEAQEAQQRMPHRGLPNQQEFDPLRPPGYSGPSYGPPGWVYALIGIGAVLLVVFLLFMLL